jgi:hypothetical protein
MAINDLSSFNGLCKFVFLNDSRNTYVLLIPTPWNVTCACVSLGCGHNIQPLSISRVLGRLPVVVTVRYIVWTVPTSNGTMLSALQ